MISIASPVIESEEIEAVEAVLRSGMLAQGPKVAELEEAFAAYCGSQYAVAVNSGTAALHAALFAAGVGPGDEVITTSFSFIATANPILFLGAKPVLVDIDPETFNLDVSKIEQAITPHTKAILPVHLYGQPCDYDELASIAKKHNLLVIEDACQAIGATYGGKQAGNLGDFGCFSLYATKNIMCGEGGMITTNNKEYADAMKRFRQHGMSGPYEYAHIGFNYRLTDVLAAIAVEQLKKLDRFTAARQRNAQRLREGLAGVPGAVLPVVAPNRTHVYHQFTVRITGDFPVSRDELIGELKKRDIGSGLFYPKPLYAYEHIAKLGYAPGDHPMVEQTVREALSLPVHPKVTDDDVDTIIAAFKEIAHAG